MPEPLPAGSADPSNNFESSLEELEQLVLRLEKGELSLDESLATFERGISLYRKCQNALDQAQLRVQMLLNPEDSGSAVPFDSETP